MVGYQVKAQNILFLKTLKKKSKHGKEKIISHEKVATK